MSKKNHIPAPVPKGNQPNAGPNRTNDDEPEVPVNETGGDQEQDPKRRLGDFVGKGEHARQGPDIDGKTSKGGKSSRKGK